MYEEHILTGRGNTDYKVIINGAFSATISMAMEKLVCLENAMNGNKLLVPFNQKVFHKLTKWQKFTQ